MGISASWGHFGVWALKAHFEKQVRRETAEDVFTFHQKKKTGNQGGVERRVFGRAVFVPCYPS